MDIPENYGIVAFKHVLDTTGEESSVTAGFHNTSIDDALTIATFMANNWTASFDHTYLSNEYTFVGAYVIINIGGVEQAAQFDVNEAGTRSSAVPSPACALCVKKQTSYAGKRYRGRFFLPAGWLTEAELSPAGVIDTSWLTPIQGFCDDLLTAMSGDGYPMYLLHTDGGTPTPVNALLARNKVRTQRRRQR